MGSQRLLDFYRRNVLPTGDDDVLRAISQFDIAIGEHYTEVAGSKPTVGGSTARLFVVLVIPQHDVVTADRDLAHRRTVCGDIGSGRIDDTDVLANDVAYSLPRFQLGLRWNRQPT